MPIRYRIDHVRRLVIAQGFGTFTDPDVFAYQREVWSRPDVVGYDELVDVSAVERFAVPSGQRVADLAALSAAMDLPFVQSRFAIVAPQDHAFGLGRMFATNRGLEGRGTKEVGVFRTLSEALAFLGVEGTSLAGDFTVTTSPTERPGE